MTKDEKTSAAIEKIRISAGGDPSRCPTCGHSPDAPFRRSLPGKPIVEGCIDAAHTKAMNIAPTMATAKWHNRSSAKAIRAKTLRWLRSL